MAASAPLRDATAVGGPQSTDDAWCEPATSRRNARIKIAFCIDNMGIGGTELNALRTAERLDRSRFDLSVICLQEDGPLLARYRARGIPVVCLPLGRLYGLAALRQGRRLARHLSSNGIDIVHSHDVYNNIFSTICARIARTPIIIASRRWWDEVPRPLLRSANRFTYRLADRVLTNSGTVADLVIRREGIHADRVVVVPNFVDEGAFTPFDTAKRAALRGELGVPADAVVVGCVAGLRPVKDHETLLLATAELRARWPSLRLVLIGDGESRASLEALIARLQLGDVVRLAGEHPNEPNLHHLLDISVLCSRSEAFPNSIVEAMAAARPVVATRVGGVCDAVADGETGLLVAPGDPRGLGAAIEWLLRHPELRTGMGFAGQRRARAHFHADSVIPMLEGIYAELLGKRAPASPAMSPTQQR